MAAYLYNRMSRVVRIALLAGMAILYPSIMAAIIYVAVHFVEKFW